MNTPRRWAVLGNPENRRVAFFQRALASRGLPPAAVVSYEGLLTGRESLETLPEYVVLRIESPGENSTVEKLLLAAGAAAAEEEGSPVLSPRAALDLKDDPGRILYPRQWYLGFLTSCSRWFGPIEGQATATHTTSPRDLRILFDKGLCHEACDRAGIPVPAAGGRVKDWDDLVERLHQAAMDRVFVKLANSSSASGVVALSHRRGRYEAITTVELMRSDGQIHLYNSLKVRRYTSLEDVRDLINTLAPHHVHVEQWLPKAMQGLRVCDLRVVVVRGEPKQMVVRTSRSPITNLHLGNRRGDLAEILAKIPRPVFESFLATCQRCAGVFADSLHLGLDVLFTPGCRRHFLLEVNAFGDLLPGVLHDGRDTYQTQIDTVLSGEGDSAAAPRHVLGC